MVRYCHLCFIARLLGNGGGLGASFSGWLMDCLEIEPTIPGREGEPWLIEPSVDLTNRKTLSTGNAVVKSDQPLLRVLMLNMSDQKRFVHPDTVFGRVNAVEETFQKEADSEFFEPEEMDFWHHLLGTVSQRRKLSWGSVRLWNM